MIEIKDIKGTVIYKTPINEGSKRKFMLMSEDYITLNFSLDKPIYFKLGDNADIKEGLFELTELYKPSYNLKEGGYDYELRLDAYYYKWRNKIFKYTHGKGGEAGWKLTAPLSAHLSLFLNNLESFGYKYRGKAFEFSIDSTVDTSSKFIEYNNTNMIDALTKMAETWDCEWWVTDNIIHFGRCEYGDPVNFELGVNLESMSRNDSQDDYATRIYAFGSDRNIPKTYRTNEESTVVNGVVQRRLMLDSPIDAYPNMSEEEAVERVVIFDDVYPHMTSNVLEVVMDEYDYKDDEDNPTGDKYPIYTIKTDIKNFSDDYLLDELRLVFQSGKMLGMDFALKLKESDETSTTFEVIRNEDYGRFFPDYDYKPLAGNTFILYGYDTSYAGDHLMGAAEKELREKAEKYVEKSKIDPSTYECALMSNWVDEDEPKRTFLPGDRINLINKTYFENGRQSRIIGFEHNLDIPNDTPIYTVGETAAYNFFDDLESRVESLTYKGETYTGGGGVYIIGVNDSTTPTSRNVFSALRSLAMFIRRDIPEFFTHLATFTKGLKIGNYVSGMIGGSGGAISVNEHGKTTAEFDSGVFRENIIVPKITFNNIDVISGDQASTFAYGTIKAVDTENKIAELDLLEGEYGTLKTGDILRGVFHNINGGNYKNDAYDTNGFLNYSGFATSYFTPTKILTNEPGKMVFQYELQGGTDIPPVKGMNFFAYGNFTDKERQSITYTNRLYTRRIMGVNKWTIIPNEHIKMQDGLIEGLSIGGMNMKGVGAYMTNLYIDGSFIIFTPQQLEELKGESAYSVHLTQESFTVRLDANENIIGGLFENKIATTLGKVTTAKDKIVTVPSYKQSLRIQAHKGANPLFYASEYKEGAFLAHIQCVGCTAEIEAGEVKLTDILSKKEAYIILTVICEGNASFERRIPISFVRDGKTGESSITADLTNDNINVACDTDGSYLFGLPATSVANMWYGGTKLKLDEILIGYNSGLIVTSDRDTGTITVSQISKGNKDVEKVTVTLKATHEGVSYTKNLVLTINKVKQGKDGISPKLYELAPSVSSVRVSNGHYEPSIVTCRIREISKDGVRVLSYSDIPAGMKITFKRSQIANTENYSYGSGIETNTLIRKMSFYLIWNDVVIDEEDIPVVIDGTSGFSEVTLYKASRLSPSVLPSGTLLPMTDSLQEIYHSFLNYWSYGMPTNLMLSLEFEDGNKQFEQDGFTIIGRDHGINYKFNSVRIKFITKVKNQKIPILYTHSKSSSSSYTNSASLKFDGIVKRSSTGNLIETLELIAENIGEHIITLSFTSAGEKNSDLIQIEFISPDFVELPVWETKTRVVEHFDSSATYFLHYDGKNKYSTPQKYIPDVPKYELQSDVKVIGTNSLGGLEPSAFLVKQMLVKRAGSAMTASYYMTAFYSKDGKEYSVIKGFESKQIESINVNLTTVAESKFAAIVLTDAPVTALPATYIDKLTVPIVRDGENLAMGSFVRNCGIYNSGATYLWDKSFRDVVRIESGGQRRFFALSVFSEEGIKGDYPPDSKNWIELNINPFMAIELAMIDNGDIAGFLFKNLMMISRKGVDKNGKEVDITEITDISEITPYIWMNGKTGEAGFGNVTVSGGIYTPFRDFPSMDDFWASKSKCWNITDAVISHHVESKMFSFGDSANGTTLRMVNTGKREFKTKMLLVRIDTSLGQKPMSLMTTLVIPEGRMFSGIIAPAPYNPMETSPNHMTCYPTCELIGSGSIKTVV